MYQKLGIDSHLLTVHFFFRGTCTLSAREYFLEIIELGEKKGSCESWHDVTRSAIDCFILSHLESYCCFQIASQSSVSHIPTCYFIVGVKFDLTE